MSIKFLNKKSDTNATVITDGQVGIGGSVSRAGTYLITTLPTIDLSFTAAYSSAFEDFYNLKHSPTITRNNSTISVTNTDNMFNNCAKLESVQLFDTSSVVNAYGMFQDCKKLKTLPNFNFSNAKVVYYMFSGCSLLESLEGVTMGAQFTSAHEMFKDCKKLKNLPASLDFSNCSNLSYLFNYCEDLEDNLTLDVANCINLSYAFTSCGKNNNPTITLTNTDKVSDWRFAFSGPTTSNISTIPSMAAATNVTSMFSGNARITTLPITSIGNAKNLYCFCYNCTALTTFPSLDLSQVTSVQRMLDGCSNLVTLPVLDLSKVTSASYIEDMVKNCASLSNDSLNNLMESLIGCGVTQTKTLKHVGVSETQAQICTTLSNYQDFLAAGWTTGYESIDNPTEEA